jgi:hypothetical protein
MDAEFDKLVKTLAPKLSDLMEFAPISHGQLPKIMPMCGIYLFSEGATHLYVGRSNNIRRRYRLHSRPSATSDQAGFAFQLARRATGYLQATYKAEGGRKWLMKQPNFIAAFAAAKVRIRAMDFRYVEQSDQQHQAILEVYASFVLKTPFNDFTNH